MFFEIPGLPPSTNQSLIVANGRLIHSAQARQYRAATEEIVQNQLDQMLRCFTDTEKKLKQLEGEPLFCHIKYFSTWITKAGTCRKKDVANMEKLLLDSIFAVLKKAGYNLDDSQLYLVLLCKHTLDQNNPDDKTTVAIDIQERFIFQ